MIISATYTAPEHINVSATYDDGNLLFVPEYEYGKEPDMDEFTDGGGVIDPYDQYYGLDLDQVKEIGYSAVDDEEVIRVKAAQKNPSIGIVLTDSDAKRANHKRDNKAKKKNNGISDADDHLLDHIDELNDFGETLRDAMEACEDNACIQSKIDTIAAEAWPDWIPI